MIRDIAFILAGYAAGSILFAKVFCSLLKKTDVAKNTKDNNPGTSNAFKNGGILCGALTLICDVTKGFLPVFFYTRKEVTFLLALVIAAPVIGHVFSVFNGFRGGKGIATTFGCLFGLFPNLIPFAIFAGTFVFFSFILKINPHFRSAPHADGLFRCQYRDTIHSLQFPLSLLFKYITRKAKSQSRKTVCPEQRLTR